MCDVGAVWGAGPVWDGCYGGVGLREGSMGVDVDRKVCRSSCEYVPAARGK